MSDYPPNVDQVRGHIETALDDDSLLDLIEAAVEEIDAIAGPVGERTVYRNGGSSIVVLPYPVSPPGSGDPEITISEIVGATETILASDDWYLHDDGVSVERLSLGTNEPPLGLATDPRFAGRVVVVYTRNSDVSRRIKAVLDLLELTLNTGYGLTGETVGSWSEQFATGARAPEDAREAILDRFRPIYPW